MDTENEVIIEEDETIDGCLNELLIDQIKKAKDLEPGSEKHKNAMEGLAKLMKVYCDDRNAFEDRNSELVMKQMETDLARENKQEDLIDQKKNRRKDIVIKACEIALTAAVTYGCTKINIKAFRESFVDALNFETDNSWSSSASRGITNQMFGFLKKK